MSGKPDPVMKPWMWILLAVALIFLIFNFDPVGDAIETVFGEGTDRWATNLVIVALMVYTLLQGRRRSDS